MRWFVVEDVVLALIDSQDSKQYVQRMKQRDPELGKGWVQIAHTLSAKTAGGSLRMLCATTEIARKQDAQGFGENKVVAHKGGNSRWCQEKPGD